MNSKHQYPKVLIVGRTNVGKSTLFNRLNEEKSSIVFNREGVTRDYIEDVVSWQGKTFTLVDTGGLSFERKDRNDIDARVQENVIKQLSTAYAILFVVDGKNGLTDYDQKIATYLRRVKKPVAVLINKLDNEELVTENVPEFYRLGIEPLFPISSIHGTGISDVLGWVSASVPAEIDAVAIEEPAYKVAIIGRPNAGKSSLMNLLIKHERSIVSDIPGTTREAISENTYYCNDLIQLTDTAGIRRSRKIDDDLEELMVHNSLSALKDSDIIILIIDASQGAIADQELKLLFYAYEQKKMILAVFNKMDLLDEYTRKMIEMDIERYQFMFTKIPYLFTSCLTQKNITKIFEEIQKIWIRSQQKFNTVQVNEVVRKGMQGKYLFHSTVELKIHFIEPLDLPIPTFILKVNFPQWFGPTELGCVENILRSHYDLKGCPVRLFPREK
jgi:GTP-binding protein